MFVLNVLFLCYLARWANLPTGLYILPSVFLFSFFFKLSKAIPWSTGPIFTIFFHQMKGICVNAINPVLFSDSSVDVAMVTNFFGKIVTKLPTPASLWHSEMSVPLSDSVSSLARWRYVTVSTAFDRWQHGRCYRQVWEAYLFATQ